MKRIMILLLKIVVIAVVALYIIVCIGYYTMQEKIIFHPQKIPAALVYQYPIPFQEVNYETPDGVTLNGVLCQQDSSKGVVLYFHGNASHVFDLGDVAARFHQNGYDALIVDYRSYGKSTGKLSEQHLFEDARFLYDELRKQYDATNIIIYGRSIGSGVATQLASKVNAKMLVLETPYASLIDLGKHYTPWLPASLLLKYPLRSDEYIQSVKSPVYILHGTADRIVPYSSGKKLSEAANTLAEFVTIQDGDHNDLADFSEYHEALDRILK